MRFTELRQHWLRYFVYLDLIVIAAEIGWLLTAWQGLLFENSHRILTPLLGAQASLFAIVLSLTTVGLQLIAPNYSPRLNWIFTENPQVYGSFMIISGSLTITLTSLLFTSYLSPRLATALLFASIVSAGVVFVDLYRFVVDSLRLTSPDGVIEEYKHRLSPSNYRIRSRDQTTDDEDRYHPLRGLYELILATYTGEQEDRTTARIALDTYCSIFDRALEIAPSDASSTLSAAPDKLTSEIEAQLPPDGPSHTVDYRDLFEAPATRHLPNISVAAEQPSGNPPESDRNRCENTVNSISALHKVGLENSSAQGTVLAHEGYQQFLQIGLRKDATHTILLGWNHGLERLPTLAEKGWTAGTYRTLIGYSDFLREVYSSSSNSTPSEPTLRTISMSQYQSALCGILEKHPQTNLEGDERRIDRIHRKQSGYTMKAHLSAEEIAWLLALTELVDGLCFLIEARYQIASDYDNTTDDAGFRMQWQQACILALQRNNEPLAFTLIQGLIETAFWSISECGDHYDDWVRTIAAVHEKDPELVTHILQRLSSGSGGRRRGVDTLVSPGTWSGLTEHDSYPGLLEELQMRLNQRHEASDSRT